MAPRARQAKGKARLNAYEELRRKDQEIAGAAAAREIHIPAGPRLTGATVSRPPRRHAAPERTMASRAIRGQMVSSM